MQLILLHNMCLKKVNHVLQPDIPSELAPQTVFQKVSINFGLNLPTSNEGINIVVV